MLRMSLLLLLVTLLPALTLAFQSHDALYRKHHRLHHHHHHHHHRHRQPNLLTRIQSVSNNDNGETNNDNDNDNKPLNSINNDEKYNSELLLDELTPPSVSFSRNSILFGDNPPTQRNNAPLRLWQGTKSLLPPIITGAWEDGDGGTDDDGNGKGRRIGKGDTKPVEHLYNLLFVRFPTVCCMVVYVRNILNGQPLVMDLGEGMFEVPPVIVFGVFLAILR
mmetsp:Transcript_15990/g.34541  ORF Transcript_15990/g.34541 Transcript_15990/m.34541 type:complete len:221 (+) Transcript_15990:139-801(+)